jgi:hypothetical protein
MNEPFFWGEGGWFGDVRVGRQQDGRGQPLVTGTPHSMEQRYPSFARTVRRNFSGRQASCLGCLHSSRSFREGVRHMARLKTLPLGQLYQPHYKSTSNAFVSGDSHSRETATLTPGYCAPSTCGYISSPFTGITWYTSCLVTGTRYFRGGSEVMSIQRSETSIPEKITDLENMHTIDRVARISFGIGLFATLHPALSIVDAPYDNFLPVLAIYPLLTGLLAWDPIYALLRVHTNTVSDALRDLQSEDELDGEPSSSH